MRAALAPGFKTATLEYSSSTDGIVRIYSSHVLDRYPLIMVIIPNLTFTFRHDLMLLT